MEGERDHPPDPVLVFDSTHFALWAEEVAREAGIAAELVPAPAGARARCNLALESFANELPRLTQVLADAGVPFRTFP